MMSTAPAFRPRKLIEYATAILILFVGVVLTATVFERIPIDSTLGIDWGGLWAGLRDGHVTYGSLLIAPWTIPVVLPLGLFSMRGSWGILTLFTILVLIASVPRRTSPTRRILSIFLLVFSWPTLRLVADGNFEALIIGGTLLILHGYRKKNALALAAGLLLATAKPQETWLLVIVVGLYVLMTWPVQEWLKSGLAVAIVAVPSLVLLGTQWLAATRNMVPPPRSLIDISLGAAISRMGLPEWVFWLFGGLLLATTAWVTLRSQRTISREKAAMLICASLLLAPYAAGNTFLTIFAIGVIPIFQAWPLIGGALIAVTDAQILIPRDFLYWNGAYIGTVMLLVVWGLCIYSVYRKEWPPREVNKVLPRQIKKL